MSYIDPHSLDHSTVFSIYSEKDEIQVNPEYQRNGDVWTLEKKQLLIDSIINRYDIPKIYFHKFDRTEARKKGFEYAIIDGRQRLEAIWQFIDGKFSLKDDITYLRDPSIDIGGMTYNDLGSKHAKIKNRFDSTNLPIIVVETDEIELIEDMFSRLNEASPLNAAEKRNAYGGDLVAAINKLSRKDFFKNKVKFGNKRYQHKEVAVRLLFLQHCLESEPRLYDTKKVYLDKFTKDNKKSNKSYVNKLYKKCDETLSYLETVFIDSDPLLSSQAVIPIYYLTYQKFLEEKPRSSFSRNKLLKFNKTREKNRVMASDDITKADFELLEFDRMSQQGTNDASSIRDRVQILFSKME
ncbi:DUF262 domain-containing protein [Shewanella insulae]|uniref:DUF262 domain-containing protein n=1 Tax=Shewanella insulae TaxID=2681496 RepID=UPI001EFE33F4|nr:DUF262 domain-containing protein [Shewanella insulae]MCG9755895.1 DUF262 domain-containing protein [Shewanella insulae]